MCSILTAPHILSTPPCAPHRSHCAPSPSLCSTGIPLFLWPLAMPHHTGVTLPTPCCTPHESHQTLGPLPWLTWAPFCSQLLTSPTVSSDPSWCPTKIPLFLWTVAAPHMITLCSHPLAASQMDLTALSDTCCALYGSLHCPLTRWCAPNRSHCHCWSLFLPHMHLTIFPVLCSLLQWSHCVPIPSLCPTWVLLLP